MRPQDLGFIREPHRRHSRLPILVFSIQEAAVYTARARAAGASGCVMKDAGGETLVAGMRNVVKSRVVPTPVMAARLRRKINST